MNTVHAQTAASEKAHKKTIALFGGSFDPPHKAHQEIPVFLLERKLVDEVWYVPVKLHPFGKNISADKDRLAMLEKVLEEIRTTHPDLKDKIKINTWELEQQEQSYTIHTLDSFAQEYPDNKFQWVIGSDNLEKFNLWQDYKRILEEYGVFVYPRQGYFIRDLRGGMHYLGDGPFIPISSTEIRKGIQSPKFVASDTSALPEFILPEVAEYATKHRLYKNQKKSLL